MRILLIVTLLFTSDLKSQGTFPQNIPSQSFVGNTTAGGKAGLAIFSPEFSNSIKVRQYSKLEIGVKLPMELHEAVYNHIHKIERGVALNPFDPDQIQVIAEFQNTNENKVVEGFYYEPFMKPQGTKSRWIADTTSFDFRVRFATGSIGKWQVAVKIISNKTDTLKLRSFEFTVTPSSNNGYVVKGNEGNHNDRYLRFDNGKPYIPVGETVAYAGWEYLGPRDEQKIENYMSEISEAGGNLVRLWMNVNLYLIEREKLGDYGRNYSPFHKKEINRQINAWELDNAFEFAENHNLYIMLAVFGSEIDPSNPEYGPNQSNWEFNPYHLDLSLKNPYEIYENAKALKYQKRRMRYVLARWGYSTSFAICEIVGEPSKWAADRNSESRKKLEFWMREMSDVVHANAFPKLTLIDFATSNSTTGWRKNYWLNTSLDIASVNNYDAIQTTNYTERWKRATKFRVKRLDNMPFIFGEIGSGLTPNLDYATDIEFHNAIWSSMFNGSLGPGIEYWWDRIHAPGASHQHNFKALRAFTEMMNLTKGNFSEQKWNDGFRYEGIVTYAVVSESNDTAYGWAHNTAYWWPNMRFTDSEVQFILDSCSAKDLRYPDGNLVDPVDKVNYCDKDKYPLLENKPSHVEGGKIKIKNVDAFSKYRIEWYSTHGNGGHLKQFDEIQNSGFGIGGSAGITFNFPALNEEYGYQDFAFILIKIQ